MAGTFLFAAAVSASAQTTGGAQAISTVRFDARALDAAAATWAPSANSFAPVHFGAPTHAMRNDAVVVAQGGGGGVGFGVTGGFTRTTLRADDLGDFVKGRTGWLAGIWFGGNRSGVVGFMGEINYVVKKTEDTGIETEVRYLEIPALFRVNIGQENKNGLNVYGLAGPVFDIKLKAVSDFGDINDSVEGLDVGIMAGGGLEILRFGFEVRGNWGLRQVNKGDFSDVDKIKTFTLEAVAKFRIN